MIFSRMRLSKCWTGDNYEFIVRDIKNKYSRSTAGYFSYVFSRERV